jgi:predicted DNA-binding mobile mystery protein A
MSSASQQLDRRFRELRSAVSRMDRPPRGWVRAIRNALGMTTRQLAERMDTTNSWVSDLERGEANNTISIKTLERAAEALGCRLVYVLVPEKPLTETIQARAHLLAEKELAFVEQTMRLEAQGLSNDTQRGKARKAIVEKLLQHPSRLWNEND